MQTHADICAESRTHQRALPSIPLCALSQMVRSKWHPRCSLPIWLWRGGLADWPGNTTRKTSSQLGEARAFKVEAARLQTCPVRGPEQRGEMNNARSVALKHREGGLGEGSGGGATASTGTRAGREGEERRTNERFHACRLAQAGRGCKKQRHPAGSGSIYQVAKEQKGAEKWEQLSAGLSSLLCLRE